MCFAFRAGRIDVCPCGRTRQFAVSAVHGSLPSELQGIFLFDMTSADRISWCLLDVYCAQEASVMKAKNVSCDKPNRRLRNSDRTHICDLIRASRRLQQTADRRAVGTGRARIVATTEMNDAGVVVCRDGQLLSPKIGEP